VPLAVSACSVLRLLILCLRGVRVDKAAGTEGLHGLSGADTGGSLSSASLLELAESEVSSTGLAVLEKIVGTRMEGLQRSGWPLIWASTETYFSH
jgi:hypothetical protein